MYNGYFQEMLYPKQTKDRMQNTKVGGLQVSSDVEMKLLNSY